VTASAAVASAGDEAWRGAPVGRILAVGNQRTRTEIVIQEEGASLVLVQGVTIGELVRALNAIGATPRDLIAILQAVKAAGAMQAELKII